MKVRKLHREPFECTSSHPIRLQCTTSYDLVVMSKAALTVHAHETEMTWNYFQCTSVFNVLGSYACTHVRVYVKVILVSPRLVLLWPTRGCSCKCPSRYPNKICVLSVNWWWTFCSHMWTTTALRWGFLITEIGCFTHWVVILVAGRLKRQGL